MSDNFEALGEIVRRIVPTTTTFRAKNESIDDTHVVVSLPRVRFLDSDPAFEARMAAVDDQIRAHRLSRFL
ncbi:hypothetical protein [Microvirga brassicacearum]|uniref:Uncharacterized protein n=1 Tax=Microvirga brassicacearum TaxID=2580413 RepID=A0A5N3PH04_9HYPH|nr:hypothetical protein [Microvirga brassicacearum]KAB0269016.1 hypothetical protein FEZ63_02600 [Microvirga brassicacearum]